MKSSLQVVDINPSDFVLSMNLDLDEQFNQIIKRLNAFKNTKLSQLIFSLLDDKEYQKYYKEAPAAMIYHHAYLGGLMQHTNEMIKITDLMCNLYDDLDRDLLVSGCILHDFGKIFEIQTNLMYNYSDSGKLKGHVAIGIEIIHDKIKKIDDFSEEIENQLIHLILSHHGEYSEQKPKTVEAVVLHHIDNLDAQTNRVYYELLKHIELDWVKIGYKEEYLNTLKLNTKLNHFKIED